MLDGILGRGFTAKCKSLIKLTNRRIDVIRRKRRATEKFLKKDIADLLLNGLDINAYGRACETECPCRCHWSLFTTPLRCRATSPLHRHP
ncbi:hypothetical protein AAZX31_16G030300 [Glycine max]|uniref:Uncharacterized protein n=1 Tax=Glycine soja TaxID=3848 RepID=A0A445GDN7_GLYSO|nr:hypothetical protein D0Y65_042564 [Glycine soja]